MGKLNLLCGCRKPLVDRRQTDEPKMIDGFFTAVFAEDTAALRSWP